MPPKAGYVTPMLHVADIARSLRFYQLLGFEVIDVAGEGGNIGWARAHCEGGALMFLTTEGEKPHPLLLYLYTPDLKVFRDHLLANGVNAPEIRHPQYMRSGELCLNDPDGNIILIGHWSEQEHAAWLATKEARVKAAGF
jgi:catechol 2,3-dioxygenase-like lactoylglutathione lyase family enzyme